MCIGKSYNRDVVCVTRDGTVAATAELRRRHPGGAAYAVAVHT